jgi:excisionase family DNA binding protein
VNVFPIPEKLFVQHAQKGKTVTAPTLWSIKQTAERFGVSEKTIRDLILKGELPAVRVGSTRTIRVRPDDAEAILRPVQSLRDDR